MIGAILLALAPAAGLIALGSALKRGRFMPDEFWPGAERLAYFVLLPALLIHGLATADLSQVPVARLMLAIALSLAVIAALLVALRPSMRIGGPAFTSVFQGGIRFNNYVGLTVAAGLLGGPGIALAAVANATIVPIANLFCILVFARFAQGQASLSGITRSIVTNPLIVASGLGAMLQATGLGLPPGLEGMIRALGTAALPIGLLCVGAGFDLFAVRRGLRATAIACAAKFLALPLATFVICMALGVRGEAALVAMLFQSLPTATSSYILARHLGGDAPLMAGIIAVQTVVAALVIPLALLAAMRGLG
ncbi:MAG: Auxin Efflux Carrier [Microvirga sp.]|nr:Auxin Efflux Carrier [Microvirga sp.]